MNRHRLAALVTTCAVLAGVTGVALGGPGVMLQSRSWAGKSALSGSTRPTKAQPTRTKPTKAQPTKARPGTVVKPLGRTWT